MWILGLKGLSAQLTCQMALIRRTILTFYFLFILPDILFLNFTTKFYISVFLFQNFINLLFSPDG